MVELWVEGKLRKSLAHEDILDFMYYCCYALKINRFKNVKVTAEFRRFKDADGWCEWKDHYVKPREFGLLIRSTMPDEDIYLTVAHEMVHVKQMLREEHAERFKPSYKTYWFWDDHTSTPYEEQPWEIEAFYLQELLWSDYKEEKQHKKIHGKTLTPGADAYIM